MTQGHTPPPDVQGQVLALVAKGVPYTQIAKLTGISTWTVRKLVKSPQAKAYIQAARQELKEQASKAVLEHGPLLDQAIALALKSFNPTTATAKDLDALFRAAHAMEKRSSSISGENKVTQQPPRRLTVTFAPWVSKTGQAETFDAVTGELITDAQLELPAQLPGSTAADPAAGDDGDDDDPA